jgi:hypothetical protein
MGTVRHGRSIHCSRKNSSIAALKAAVFWRGEPFADGPYGERERGRLACSFSVPPKHYRMKAIGHGQERVGGTTGATGTVALPTDIDFPSSFAVQENRASRNRLPRAIVCRYEECDI